MANVLVVSIIDKKKDLKSFQIFHFNLHFLNTDIVLDRYYLISEADFSINVVKLMFPFINLNILFSYNFCNETLVRITILSNTCSCCQQQAIEVHHTAPLQWMIMPLVEETTNSINLLPFRQHCTSQSLIFTHGNLNQFWSSFYFCIWQRP